MMRCVSCNQTLVIHINSHDISRNSEFNIGHTGQFLSVASNEGENSVYIARFEIKPGEEII